MNKEDSMIMRALAEVAFMGYIDNYGNRVDTVSQLMNQFKPSEDFYKRLEKKMDIEKLADRMIERLSNFSSYDRNSFTTSVTEQAKKIVAEKLAEKMMNEMNAPKD